jgi:hypothetical protein
MSNLLKLKTFPICHKVTFQTVIICPKVTFPLINDPFPHPSSMISKNFSESQKENFTLILVEKNFADEIPTPFYTIFLFSAIV